MDRQGLPEWINVLDTCFLLHTIREVSCGGKLSLKIQQKRFAQQNKSETTSIFIRLRLLVDIILFKSINK